MVSPCIEACDWLRPSLAQSLIVHDDVIKWKHFPRSWPYMGEFTGHRWIPLIEASDAELWSFLWSAPEQIVEQTIETPMIWEVIALIMTSLYWKPEFQWRRIDVVCCTSIVTLQPWASYQIRNIAGCAYSKNAGNVTPIPTPTPPPQVSDPDMHHGTCRDACRDRLQRFPLNSVAGKTFPTFPAHAQPAVLHIW